jgi:signal peptidase I
MADWLANLSVKWVLVAVGLLLVVRMTLPRVGALPRQWADSMVEFLESALVALVLVFLVIRPFVVQAFYIPSESMLPTLRPGDRMLVNKFVFRFRGPRGGDIVVFRAPQAASMSDADEVDFIKRVIGLPGETIEVVPDTVMVDGKPAAQLLAREQAFPSPYWRNAPPRGLLVGKNTAIRIQGHQVREEGDVRLVFSPSPKIEFRNGSVYVDGEEQLRLGEAATYRSESDLDAVGGSRELSGTVIYAPQGDQPLLVVVRGRSASLRPGHVRVNGKPIHEPYVASPPRYVLPPVQVPPGHYFVMGDNRNDSNDSHAWGPLAADRILGKAMFIFWPPARVGFVQ